MSQKLPVYIGYDDRNYNQLIAYRVCQRSLQKHSSSLEIIPIRRTQLMEQDLYWRADEEEGSTNFSFTRFLVPYLQNYQGWALFCDSDFIYFNDLAQVMKLADPSKAVQCVQHKYTDCPDKVKMNGKAQVWYQCKNWSSFILFNCAHPSCRKLTPEVVSTSSSRYLHQFQWCEASEIGHIPLKYNWLEGYYQCEPPEDVVAIHVTDGFFLHPMKGAPQFPHAEIARSYMTEGEKRKAQQFLNHWYQFHQQPIVNHFQSSSVSLSESESESESKSESASSASA